MNTATAIMGSLLDSLRSVREKKKLSLEEISRTTKIGVHYLRAIEECEFEKLPGGVYNCSYIRQYAREIDYNETELLEFYRAKTEPAPAPDTHRKGLADRLHLPASLFRGLTWPRLSL